MIHLEQARQTWSHWLTHKALPLWSGAGFNRQTNLFHERLTWEHTPIALPQLRLMVQARQIATYCRAESDGLFHAADQALSCLNTIEKLYWRRDGQAGWIFSIDQHNNPADTTRDLYAHAFILYAYAWAYNITQNTRYRDTAKIIFHEVLEIFHTPVGGFLDTQPDKDHIRRQNPHMHLLEAFLALFESTQDPEYLHEAEKLIALAKQYFISSSPHLLLEYFDAALSPLHARGQNRVEPGHMFEWAWLFTEYLRLHPAAANTAEIQHIAQALQNNAERYGLIRNRVIDAINDATNTIACSSRIWPQTEFLRLICTKNARENIQKIRECSHILLNDYLKDSLNGGWIDRLTPEHTAISDHMPASTLYHIYGAAREMTMIDRIVTP